MRPDAGVFLLLFILFGVLGRSLGMIRNVKKTSALFPFICIATEEIPK